MVWLSTMSKCSTKLAYESLHLGRNQRGITALETSIILIAFVVVASVFAFGVLNTGLMSSEKGNESVQAGLDETSANLALRGGVIATANEGKTAIDTIKFYLTPTVQSTGSSELSGTSTVVTYVDSNISQNCTAGGAGSCSWTANWIIGSGDMIESGERVEMIVTLTGLTPPLGKNTQFTIQVRPSMGAPVVVNKTIPGEVKAVMEIN